MPKRDHSSNSQFTHQLFHGTTWHSRLLPSVHKFTYPYRYWGVNISALAAGDGLPEVASMQLQNNHTHSAKLFNKLPFGAAIIKGLPIFSAKHDPKTMIESSFLSEGEMGFGLNSVRNFITLGQSVSPTTYLCKERNRGTQAQVERLRG